MMTRVQKNKWPCIAWYTLLVCHKLANLLRYLNLELGSIF